MTRAQATAEARRRWGPTGEVREFDANRQHGAPAFVEVGTYDEVIDPLGGDAGFAEWNPLGAGRTFEAAFADADRSAATPGGAR